MITLWFLDKKKIKTAKVAFFSTSPNRLGYYRIKTADFLAQMPEIVSVVE